MIGAEKLGTDSDQTASRGVGCSGSDLLTILNLYFEGISL